MRNNHISIQVECARCMALNDAPYCTLYTGRPSIYICQNSVMESLGWLAEEIHLRMNIVNISGWCWYHFCQCSPRKCLSTWNKTLATLDGAREREQRRQVPHWNNNCSYSWFLISYSAYLQSAVSSQHLESFVMNREHLANFHIFPAAWASAATKWRPG